jgi:hypothetical protein
MSTHDSPTIRRFVRTAWILLAFQLVFALGAVGVAIWAASAVRQAVDQRDLLQARVAELEARPAAPAPAPVQEVAPAPGEEPAPVVEDLTPQPQPPQPQAAPAPPVVRTQPPVRQPPVRNPPPYRPPVYVPPPPVYQPPVYVPPPRVDDKPPVVRDDPPPERPRPRRPRINIDLPGLLGGRDRPSRDRPTREPNNPNVRIPGTSSTNPNGRQSARPPATNLPNTTTVRRRPRPSTNDNPPPPSIR